jgi:DNA polymerase (family X)
MKLEDAIRRADSFLDWIVPRSVRAEVAGSIRRERLEVGDIDIVCVPKTEVARDLLGAVVSTSNETARAIRKLARETDIEGLDLSRDGDGIQTILRNRNRPNSWQIDIFYTTEEHWGATLLCRTGSKEHNILLATRALSLPGNLRWEPHKGVLNGPDGNGRTEEGVYAALGLRFIPPERRDAPLNLSEWLLPPSV